MSSNQLFWLLLTTGLMLVLGTREIHQRRFAMGSTLILIPVAGWVAIWLGRP